VWGTGTGDEVTMSIAATVSCAIISIYSHVRMEAKRRALDEIAARQRAADQKRSGGNRLRQGLPLHHHLAPTVSAPTDYWIKAEHILSKDSASL
jgi:hypothetical protein